MTEVYQASSQRKENMIVAEMEKALAHWYPGSRLDDTYYFVLLSGWEWCMSTLDAGVSAVQIYEDLFRSEDRLLVTCVSLDLSAYLPAGTYIEERSIVYIPDWNVEHIVQQRFASIRGQDLDAEGFFGAVIGSAHAAYVICPRTGFALTYDGCFAPTAEGQAELQRRYPART